MPGRILTFRCKPLAALASLAALSLCLGFADGAQKQDKKAKKKADKADNVSVDVKPAKSTTPVGKLDSLAVANLIDRAIDAQLKAEKITPSPRSDDAEFLRRVYLDLTGTIPTAAKAAAFLDSQAPDKRAKLIDELLASPQYGKHQADIWQALLLPRNSDSRRLQFAPMVQWLETNFNENKPWDRMVHDLVTAKGTQDKNGAVTFYLANNTVDKQTDSVTKLFLGVQLQCAQCHNHPFVEWKQTEYWGMAAFFMKVQIEGPRNPAQSTDPPGINEVANPRRGRNALPEAAKRLPPKFLQGEVVKVTASEPLRPVLADWLTSPKNPYFSKAMVNRTWHQLFGRGQVNPVDDMHDGNAPSHPQLVKDLAQKFAAGGFDLKGLIRGVCNSQAYQRTSKPFGNNLEASPALYSHMPIKVLTPGQLFDSLGQALGSVGRAGNLPRRAGNGARAAGPRDQFIAFFGVEDGADPTDYQVGIPQALRLMNGQALNTTPRARELSKLGKPAQVIEALFLTALSRRPTANELKKMEDYVQQHSSEKEKAYADILWVLINSSEFTLNR